jgi:predicted transcriptional regulator
MGLLDDNAFNLELARLNGSKPKVVTPEVVPSVPPIHQTIERPGRQSGDNNVPDSLRKIIGEDALLNGRQSAVGLAKSFGISASSVSAYSKGSTSTDSYNQPKQSIIEHINKSRARVIKKASKTLNGALEAITQEKLDYTDAKDLSVIAKNMSGIIKDLEPTNPTDTDSKSSPQFIIYAPQFKSENSFDVIQVNE